MRHWGYGIPRRAVSSPPNRSNRSVVITVVGLGPGDPGLITGQTLAAIEEHPTRFLRTTRHPSAHLVPGAQSFDSIYESADTFAAVYEAITERLLTAAAAEPVIYAVPGSPLVLERTVQLLRQSGAELRVLPAVGFLDVVWERLGIDPVEASVRLIDGHTFSTSAAGQTGPLLVAHTHANWVLSEIKLAVDATDETTAIILQGLGTPNEVIQEVAWSDLDRSIEADHLTSVYIPVLETPVAHELMQSVELIHRLRRDCPWDAEQTHQSLRRHLVEETYEVLDAIDGLEQGGAPAYEHLEEELGDLWFQVLFHSELAGEAGQFTIADVARGIHDKLVSRHPHVFGEAVAADAAAVLENWEQAKLAEKNRTSVMDGIPEGLPALTFAEKVLKKGMRSVPVDIGESQLRELAQLDHMSEESVSRALLAIVELARRHNIDPEGALRVAVKEARDRFKAVEGTSPRTNWILG